MWALFEISTDCFLYGILIAAVTMILLYFALQMVSKSCVKTLPFYIAGIVLAPLLVVQDTLIVVAFQAKGMIDAVEIYVQQLIGEYNQNAMSMQETQAVLEQVGRDFPLIGWFFNITNIQVDNAQNLANEMVELMHQHLNAFLWKRFGWCTVFIILAILITFLSDKKNKHKLNESTRSSRSSRGSSATTRADRHTGRSSRRHRY